MNMEYFVGEKYIRKFLNANIEWTLLEPLVKRSALTYLRPLLGFRFFEDLLTKYNDETLSAIEIELVEMIKYIQGLRVKYESVYETSIQSSNKGFMFQNGDNMNSSTMEDLDKLRGDLSRKIEDDENVMLSWLIFNKDDFPLFTDTTNDEIQPPLNNGYPSDGDNFSIL